MSEPIILDQSSREAVHAAKNAAQALELARVKQINDIADKVTEFIPDEDQMARIVRTQVEHVLARGTEQEKSIILARVPFLCQDVKDTKTELKKANERGERLEQMIVEMREDFNSKLANYSIVQAIVFGLVGLIVTAFVGALIMNVFK